MGGFTAVGLPIFAGVGAFLAPTRLADDTLTGNGIKISEAKSGPGKNDTHVNQDRKTRAADAAQKAKEKYEQLKSKPNKTPEDKKAQDKAKKEYEHQRGKAEDKGENHSQKGKGQQS